MRPLHINVSSVFLSNMCYIHVLISRKMLIKCEKKLRIQKLTFIFIFYVSSKDCLSFIHEKAYIFNNYDLHVY